MTNGRSELGRNWAPCSKLLYGRREETGRHVRISEAVHQEWQHNDQLAPWTTGLRVLADRRKASDMVAAIGLERYGVLSPLVRTLRAEGLLSDE